MPPFLMKHGWFQRADSLPLDEVMAVFMPRGRSYTGFDQVEIYCHGGAEVVKLLLEELLRSGARAAEPGEFTRLAFLSGRIDLAKAEAVAEMIEARTANSLEAAREHLTGAYSEHIDMLRNGLVAVLAEIEASIDFPEEEIAPDGGKTLADDLEKLIEQVAELKDSYSSGRILRDGFRIVIGGRPNAGKSTLFNLLLKQERALVTEQPGTTRDYLSEWIEIEGVPVNLIDTAGLRLGGSRIEKAGQNIARKLIDKSDLLIWVVDMSRKRWRAELKSDLQDLKANHILLVGNKIDALTKPLELGCFSPSAESVMISCRSGEGLDRFSRMLASIIMASVSDMTSGLIVTSARHKQKLTRALSRMKKAGRMLKRSESPELIGFELKQAVVELDELTGRIYNDEILERIFSKFCIGK